MKQENLQLTGANFRRDRRELDYYPTPENVTVALMEFLADHGIFENGNVWEPACGNGAMSKVIERYRNYVYSSDIEDRGYGASGIDFLKVFSSSHEAIITNPPFKESEQFIRHATGQARVVCMLLKSQYWHAEKRGKLFEELPPAYVLPLLWRPDFLEHTRRPGDKGGAPTMEVCWNVWIAGVKETRYLPLKKPR